MNKFIGREIELKNLNNMYRSDKFEMAVIYGRRRVGKTSNYYPINLQFMFKGCKLLLKLTYVSCLMLF